MGASEERNGRLRDNARCMEQPEAQGTQELAADIRGVLSENEELREALAELLEHVEAQNCDVLGAIQQARLVLMGRS